MINLIRVVIADDVDPIAHAIADSLAMEEDIEVLGIGHTGQEAVDLVDQLLPDVLLLDLGMPVMGGLEALRKIKEKTPSTEVLILTVHDDDANLFNALQTGAKGYLLKSSTLDEITCAVREVARGVASIPASLAGRVLSEFQRLANQGPAIRNLYSVLTRQEVEVLRLIGLKRTNRQIADELHVEPTTVKKHVSNIRQKLEINRRNEAVLVAQSTGLASS